MSWDCTAEQMMEHYRRSFVGGYIDLETLERHLDRELAREAAEGDRVFLRDLDGVPAIYIAPGAIIEYRGPRPTYG